MSPQSTAESGEVREVRLVEALSERYLAYALSTIMSRSLPDVRDGLKPVHRRLLFAMRELRLNPDTPYKKSARVVGDVIGKYHPHGDQSIYDALVRLAQDFALRYPLIDGQGNFGNIDGDNAAAMRYTEARLTAVAARLLEGIDEDAVDFRQTYDGEALEPVVLPANFPNLLANGAQGIAVGMATSIPPHNVAELADALIHLVRHPNAAIETLVDRVQGPDFPTGGLLVEPRASILESYRTGRGSFRLRARFAEPEQLSGGRYQLVVTEIPYQVSKSKLIERIAELLEQKKLPLLADIRDESADDVRLVFEPKSRNVDPEHLKESLYRTSELEVRIPLNLNVIEGSQTPRVMSLKEALQAYIDHRLVVLERRTRHRLGKIAHRLEILGGYLVAYLNLDEVIRIIREVDEPKADLMRTFELTDVQAEAILNMRLRALRRLEEMEIRKEHEGLSAEQADLTALLEDEARRFKVLEHEFKDLKKDFGPDTPLGRRRTEVSDPPSAIVVPLEAVIEREPVTVLLSAKGWIRAMKGHGTVAADAKYKEGDKPGFAIACQTTDKLLVFATNGRMYTLGADKLPGGRGFGEPLRLIVDLPQDQDVVDVRVHVPGGKLLVAASDGRGFVVLEEELIAQTKNGKQVLNLADGAEALVMRPVPETADHLAVIGENRKLLAFPLDELPEMARGRGVTLQKYRDGGLRDAKPFRLEDGLTVQLGPERSRTFDMRDYLGKRAAAGRLPPAGFPKHGRFD